APACVVAVASAVSPAAPSRWPAALPSALAVAPAPSAAPSEGDGVLAEPPPSTEWLSDWALAEAASAAVELNGAIGMADRASAKALVDKRNIHLLFIQTSKNWERFHLPHRPRQCGSKSAEQRSLRTLAKLPSRPPANRNREPAADT